MENQKQHPEGARGRPAQASPTRWWSAAGSGGRWPRGPPPRGCCRAWGRPGPRWSPRGPLRGHRRWPDSHSWPRAWACLPRHPGRRGAPGWGSSSPARSGPGRCWQWRRTETGTAPGRGKRREIRSRMLGKKRKKVKIKNEEQQIPIHGQANLNGKRIGHRRNRTHWRVE